MIFKPTLPAAMIEQKSTKNYIDRVSGIELCSDVHKFCKSGPTNFANLALLKVDKCETVIFKSTLTAAMIEEKKSTKKIHKFE